MSVAALARAQVAPLAPGSAARSAEVDAYCRHVIHAAASRSALMTSPWVFSTLGTLSASASGDGLESAGRAPGDPSLSLQAGMGFSPTRLYAGGLVRVAAEAECERFRAEGEVVGLLRRPEGRERAALAAKAGILRSALPGAGELLEGARQQLDEGRSTLQEYSATALRVQALQRELAETDARLAALPEGTAPRDSPSAAFAALRGAEARRQTVEGRQRRSAALDVTFRGGYQEIFGLAQRYPVFGSLTVQFSPGWFWQHASDERSAAARGELVEARIAETRRELGRFGMRVREELTVAERRLTEVSTMQADLEQRYASLEQVGTRQAREFREYLWFDLVRMSAERAFAAAHVQTLSSEAAQISDAAR
jgi:hypothetical protein